MLMGLIGLGLVWGCQVKMAVNQSQASLEPTTDVASLVTPISTSCFAPLVHDGDTHGNIDSATLPAQPILLDYG
jgi:hypothetical protein